MTYSTQPGGVVPDKGVNNLFLWQFASDATDSFENYDGALKTGATIASGKVYIDRNTDTGARVEIFNQSLAHDSSFAIMMDLSSYDYTSGRFFYEQTNDRFDVKHDGSGHIQIAVRDSGGSYHTYTGSATLPATDADWSLAISATESGALKVWIDGVLDIDTTMSDLYVSTNLTIQVPRTGQAGVGSLDNVCMFNTTIDQTDVDAWMGSSAVNVEVIPDALAITTTVNAPTSIIGNASVSLSAIAITSALQTPTSITATATVNPSAIAITTSLLTPSITIPINLVVSPDTLLITITICTPTISGTGEAGIPLIATISTPTIYSSTITADRYSSTITTSTYLASVDLATIYSATIIANATIFELASLTGHWLMNDNAASTTVLDDLELNNGATQQNTEDITTTGKINSALNFANQTDFIDEIPNTVINKTEGSICGWFKPDSFATRQLLVWAGDAAGNGWSQNKGVAGAQELHLSINHFSNTQEGFSFFYGHGDDSAFVDPTIPGVEFTYVYSESLTAGEWYHVVATWDFAARKTKLYVNGALSMLAEMNPTELPYDTDQWQTNMLIGASGANAPTGRRYEGDMDDIRIYDKALNGDEVLDIYNSGSGKETQSTSSTVFTGSLSASIS